MSGGLRLVKYRRLWKITLVDISSIFDIKCLKSDILLLSDNDSFCWWCETLFTQPQEVIFQGQCLFILKLQVVLVQCTETN